MTLDEAIKHAEEVANECTIYFQTSDNEVTKIPSQCAEEHRQLAEWLKELKELREQKRPHGEWICKDTIYGQALGFSCSNCKMPEYKISLFCPNCGAVMGGAKIDAKKGETE